MTLKMSLPVDAMIHDCQNVTPRGRYDSWLKMSLPGHWFMIVKMSLGGDAVIHDSKCHSQDTMIHDRQNVTPNVRYDSWLSKYHSQ